MNIQANRVALIHYTLTNGAKERIDSSVGSDPLAYIHGNGNLLEGLEKELEGKIVGDKLNVSLSPEEGYGLREEGLIQRAPKSDFPDDSELEIGAQFHAETPNGVITVTVSGVEGDEVLLDGNHPLAGQALNFDIEVMEVRDATQEELEHGHAHGEGGHQH